MSNESSNPRRLFLKQTLAGAGVLLAPTLGWSASSYRRIVGANDRVRVGVVGFSDRHKGSHMPSFMNHYKELNFDVVGVSDIWQYIVKGLVIIGAVALDRARLQGSART